LKTQRWYGIKKRFYTLSVFAIIFAFVSCNQNVAYIDRFGDVDVSLGNYDEAIKDYTKAINYKPTDPDGYIGRAYVYQKMGNHRLAIEDYSKAIELVPYDSNLYFARGSAYELLGNNDASVRDYQRAAALGNDNARSSLISKGIGW
jgi:tetratricopeptide (TPR) repeat protein